MQRILLGQLGANGDCLYATIIARQLRHNHPEAHITWAISSQCSSLLTNNPDVNEIWSVPIASWAVHQEAWWAFEREALRCYGRREFDEVLLTQNWPNNFQNFDGTVRPSILRAFKKPITVPVENVIALTPDEIDRVESFVRANGVTEREHRILFECSSKSGQSFVTPAFAQEVADHLYRRLPDAIIIFSTHLPIELRDSRSRQVSMLSLRETAHLTHHCTLFVGAGSGGTVAASSTASRPLPMILLLLDGTSVFASFAHDFEYFGVTRPPVIEITSEDPQIVAQCIEVTCRNGAESALTRFGGRIPVVFDHYFRLIESQLLARSRYLDAAQSLEHTAARYGWTNDLIDFGRTKIAPHLATDPSWIFVKCRQRGEAFRSALHDAARSPALSPRQSRYAHHLIRPSF
jgi:hypothetical protein